MSQNPFDQACRYLCKLDPPAMLGWLLGLKPTQFTFHRWLDTRTITYPGQPDRTCDTVAHLENLDQPQEPWAILTEFQIEPDPLMFGRIIGYFSALWMEHKPSMERGDRFQLAAVVVNLTGRGRAGRRMEWLTANLTTIVQPTEWNLAQESAQMVLAAIEAGNTPMVVLPFVPLMQNGGDADTIQKWVELANRETDAVRRNDYGGLARVFADAAGCESAWAPTLKEWNMVQSKVVEEWKKEGRQEGRQEGQRFGILHAIEQVLRTRFGNLPIDVRSQLERCVDSSDLDSILIQATIAPSLDAFRASLPAEPS